MGKLLFLVRRSLGQHMLSTVVTVLATGLAAGLVMAVFSLSAQTRTAFAGGDLGFDAVLGARGSQLQLVLNTVFHLETSPGNIPYSLYKDIKGDPAIEMAIPYALGDNYEGFRIVGTTEEIFRFEYREGERFRLRQPGRAFNSQFAEAVIGSRVADRTGLKPGDRFFPTHGVTPDGVVHDRDEFLVVAVMEPTNSPSDRVIWIPIEAFFRIGGHYLANEKGEHYEPKDVETIPDEHKELSAVMLRFRGRAPMTGMRLSQRINRSGKVATLAWPLDGVMGELFDKLGWVTRVLQLVAYLVVLVAIGSILASLYNTMNERRREFAILRALGARRATVFSAIVAESAAIAVLGALIGYVFYWLILTLAAVVVKQQTGVVVEVMAFHPILIKTPIAMIVLGAAAGLLPAAKAYRTDVASNLVPQT
ncbi:MAG: ABC transporter permease [Planctomycetota bacterium]|nr:ABC transporter permease [Planctomycetota bacterium]